MSFKRTDRLDQLPPYLFIAIDRKKHAALAAGEDVIDFGVGDPDRPTPRFIIDRCSEAIYDPKNHSYPFDTGVPEFRDAAARFMMRRFGVELDPASEIISLIGTKEGIGHLPLAVVNPGDVALVPTPGYPVYQAAVLFAGGVVRELPLTPGRGFLPNLDEVPGEVLDKTALMFLNYPNNPTGAVAPLELFEQCVALAQRHDFVICSDAAYTELYFDERDRPHSILEVAGAKDVCIEMHSLSKTFNMTGWRLGFGAGGAEILAALAKIKGNMDSGVFGAVQHAGIAALDGIEHADIAGIRRLYRQRRDALVPRLAAAGFGVEPPRATFYVWARCPDGYDSMACATKLLDEAAIVAIPGVGFGKPGDAYVRFALTVEVERIAAAMDRLTELAW